MFWKCFGLTYLTSRGWNGMLEQDSQGVDHPLHLKGNWGDHLIWEVGLSIGDRILMCAHATTLDSV